jgi:Flp pilus assembly protein TadG
MLRRSIAAFRSFFGPVLGDRSGVAAVFLAVALVPLIGAVGLAIDSSRGYLLKTRMGKALDTAGLAAGRVALDANAEDVAQQFFDANFGTSNVAVTVEPIDFDLDPSFRFITLSTRATTPTRFMRVFGHETMTVSARAVIERETTGMELALVMDNTGSMWGSAFDAMQAAAFDLVDILYGSEETIENLWVSLVPYTATINIGSSRTGWVQTGDRIFTNMSSFRPDLTGGGWKGCVMARGSGHDADDAPPSVAKFSSYFYPATSRTQDNNWPTIKPALSERNDGRGPNLGCGPAITPLTASKTEIDAAIGNMGAWHRGGTTGNLGLSWGWRTLSPQWRGLWGGSTPSDMPLDYGTNFMEKVVVILTDGNNQFYDHDSGSGTPGSDFTSYGRLDAMGVSNLGQGRAILDTRMAGTCAAMKAEGIRIYSIIFGASPDSTAQTLFRNCATTPAMYYYAPNNAQLSAAFRAIGGQLANLRIVE